MQRSIILLLMLILGEHHPLLHATQGDTNNIGVISLLVSQATKENINGKTEILHVGMPIIDNETIKTGKYSHLQIEFVDGSSMKIAPNSHVTFDIFEFNPNNATGKFTTKIKNGALQFTGGILSKKKDQVTIHTHNSTLNIQGGIARFSYTREQGTTATLIHGTLNVKTIQGEFKTSHIGTKVILPEKGHITTQHMTSMHRPLPQKRPYKMFPDKKMVQPPRFERGTS